MLNTIFEIDVTALLKTERIVKITKVILRSDSNRSFTPQVVQCTN